MKFLSKNPESKILKQALIFRSNSSRKNKKIRELLLQEQRGFCAYSEQFIGETDSVEIEHFNPSLKDKGDNYYNYYAVIRYFNQRKQHKYRNLKDSEFFKSLFFQNPQTLSSRIQYIHDKNRLGGTFEPLDPEDQDAQNLIDYLGWNDNYLYEKRKNHLKRLKKSFQDANYNHDEQLAYFRDFPQELSYMTVLEAEFDMDLMPLLHPNQTQQSGPGERQNG